MKKLSILLALVLIFTGCQPAQSNANTQTTEPTTKEPIITDNHTEKSLTVETTGGKLGCTLTMPNTTNGTIPVVLLVPGSGTVPKDGIADEFKLLAQALANNGIASLRYDKRGSFDSSNIVTTNEETSVLDFVTDIKSLLKHLKTDDKFSKVFLLGHSQGSLYGAIAAKDENVDGFISVAGAGRTIDIIMNEQITNNKYNPEALVKESAEIIAALKNGKHVETMSDELAPLFRPSIQNYLIEWMTYDPIKEFDAIKETPLLIVQGDNDIQIQIEDANLLAKAVPDAKLVIIKNMTHVLKNLEKHDDMEAQQKVYLDKNAPINQELVNSIINFINK